MGIEYYKEKNLVQQININMGPNQHVFNTSKHNKSILTSPAMLSYFFMLILYFVLAPLKYGLDIREEGTTALIKYFYWTVLMPLILKIILPSIILYNNPGMWNLMFRTIKDFFHLQNPPHLVHE